MCVQWEYKNILNKVNKGYTREKDWDLHWYLKKLCGEDMRKILRVTITYKRFT